MGEMPLHRRVAIEEEIELHLQRADFLIRRLDQVDAPFEDLEDDDPAGTDLDDGEGVGDDGRGLLPDRPMYAVDQSTGPTNHRRAEHDHYCRNMGMVRGRDGKWRMPPEGARHV